MSEPLKEPEGVAPPTEGSPVWRVFTSAPSVADGWDAIIGLGTNDAARAYAWLRDHPFTPHKRCFPMRGKQNRGVWQYEVNATYRLRYVKASDADDAVVLVYAGDYH